MSLRSFLTAGPSWERLFAGHAPVPITREALLDAAGIAFWPDTDAWVPSSRGPLSPGASVRLDVGALVSFVNQGVPARFASVQDMLRSAQT